MRMFFVDLSLSHCAGLTFGSLNLQVLVRANFVDQCIVRMASTIRSVILNVHQDFAEHLLLTYPGVAVAFVTVDQLEACNSYLCNMRTVYPGDCIPEQLVKDIELCLVRRCILGWKYLTRS